MEPPVDWPVPDPLAWRADRSPEQPALIAAESERAWTYEALSAGPVDRLTAGIRAGGMEPGGHLGVLAGPGVDLAQLVHASARAGVVFVPLRPDAPAAVVGDRCEAAAVEALVTLGPAEVSGLEGFDGPVRTVDDLESTGDKPTPHRWARDDVQWLVFTSGTTDRPRPVELTAGNLLASATASAQRLGVEPDDRWLACLPMHHVGGLAPLVRAAVDGTTVVVQAGFDVDATAEAMVDHGVTGVSLIPTMLQRLLDGGWRPPDSLRFVLLGGAPATPDLIDRCASVGLPVYPTYGATETASQIATATPGEAFEHRGTVGRPLVETTVDVLTTAGESLPPGETGELVVSGPTVSPGYYGDASVTAERFDGGAFHTRDRGYRDAAGRLWVVGRLDAAITTGGETVHADTVESALRSHPAVADAVVVGLEDAEWGQVVAALVTGSGSGTLDVDAVRDHARDRLDPVAVPKLVVEADRLPRTASGTVDQPAARDRLRAARREGL